MNKEKNLTNLKWYAIKGASGKEKSISQLIIQRAAANNLTEKITEVLVPIQEKVVIKNGKKQTVLERFLPGYILVQMEITEETAHLIRNTENVLGFVGLGHMQASRIPRAIPEKDLQSILALMKIKQEPVHQANFASGDAVKVIEGAFKDFIGNIKEINANKGQAVVLLSIFGRETPVTLNFLQINKI